MQLEAHAFVQAPSHVLLHPPEQPKMQLEAEIDLALTSTKGMFDSIVIPKIGKVDFAAFLKNSLRDWSSSFLFLLDIKL